MSDQSYDSVLVGYTEEPRYYEGNLSSWSVKLKDSELKEMLESISRDIQELEEDAGDEEEVYELSDPDNDEYS